ncbi:TonB family protein [Salinisphaera sp. Q1T1-3]|uniref:TonB family protein n=1 Tax=Salinisphaera sp. Q1T1-3 TaxID=2321229 RepID=UPI0013141DC9|nr:TonB family protein [Salinisphaera sp. Q1T1-3]
MALGLVLTGCTTTPAIQPVSAWKQVSQTADPSIETQASTTDGQRIAVRLTCGTDRKGPGSPLRLAVETDTEPDGNGNGTITFGDQPPFNVTWRSKNAETTPVLPVDTLATGLASVFRSHRRVVLTHVPGFQTPLHFTVGQGPYESVGANFMAHCPPIASQMPVLVRIRASTLVPMPKPVPKERRYAVPRYPSNAIQEGHEGTVHLVSAVDTQGNVLWPEIVGSSGYGELDAAAKAAWATMKYEPTPRLGQNELYLKREEITFTLP